MKFFHLIASAAVVVAATGVVASSITPVTEKQEAPISVEPLPAAATVEMPDRALSGFQPGF